MLALLVPPLWYNERLDIVGPGSTYGGTFDLDGILSALGDEKAFPAVNMSH